MMVAEAEAEAMVSGSRTEVSRFESYMVWKSAAEPPNGEHSPRKSECYC